MFCPALIANRGPRSAGLPLPHVANAGARLSLTGISPGYRVIQDDEGRTYQYNGDAEAVRIIGAGSSDVNGIYTYRRMYGGKPLYQLIGVSSGDETIATVVWSGGIGEWRIYNSSSSHRYVSTDDVAYPWLVTTWSESDGAPPVPTTAHIASKNALTNAVFVSGAGDADVDGIYTERPAVGLVNGKPVYVMLGVGDDTDVNAIAFDTRWQIFNGGGVVVYRSDSGEAYPWLVAGWSVTFGSVPAPTVSAVTQGELDAGVTISESPLFDANDVYVATAIELARNKYLGLSHGNHLVDPSKDRQWWVSDFGNPLTDSGDNPAFPWEAETWTGGTIVTRNDIASESNWEPLP